MTAPHDGLVATVATSVGETAAPGRTLLTLTDPADRFLRIYVPETRLGEVAIGNEVTVVARNAEGDHKGTVTWVATEPEFTPNNVQTPEQRATLVYQVKIALADAEGLRRGMPVDVTLS